MRVIEIFKELSKIEHCSKNTTKLLKYLQEKSEKYGYKTQIDKSGNLYSFKDGNKYLLQSHYDMVCIGKAPELDIYEEDGFLKAKNSSLGADNGIAVAMILELMEKGEAISALFTNDEEIGLIGANNLELDITETKVINIDSEDEGDVFIGCAGGIDFIMNKKLEALKIDFELDFYELKLSGYPGGHSGLEIDKNIPNAIQDILKNISSLPIYLVSLNGGEKRNSIPKTASVIVGIERHIPMKVYNNDIEVIRLENKSFDVIANTDDIMETIINFKHGLRSFNNKLNVPQTSINLAIVNTEDNELEIILSGRSMDNKDLEDLIDDTESYFSEKGFKTFSEFKYPSWQPEITEFSNMVLEESKKVFNDSEYKAMHAGLECAVIKSKFPNIDIVSVGPNIYNPHTDKESVEIESVLKVNTLIHNIIKN